MVTWTVVRPTASVCRLFIGKMQIVFNQLLTVYIYTAFRNQQSNNKQCLIMTLIALMLSIFDFLHNLFTKINVLPNLIKINERIIKCASYNFQNLA